jgi:hypothetical protein
LNCRTGEKAQTATLFTPPSCTTAFILIFHAYLFKVFASIIIYVINTYTEECHTSRTATAMGLLTWDIPSSHTKEAESIYLPIILSIVSANDNFCPRDVNDRMLEFTLILSQGGCHNGFIHRHFFLFS